MAELPANYRNVQGSERRPARGARRVSDADPTEKFSFTVRVRRRVDAPALPDQSYWAANPTGSARFPSPDKVLANASAAQGDLDKVTDFARSHGFEIVEVSAARRTVRLSGTVDQANRTFAIELGQYESDEETYRGREGAVSLPTDVADVVSGIFGLDNRKMARRGGNGDPAGTTGLTPLQVAALYNFPTSLQAAGQTVGIIEFGGGFKQSDLDLFCQNMNVPAPTPTLISVNGQTTNVYAGSRTQQNLSDQEVALDVQVVASVAQGARINMYFAPNSDDGWIDAVTTAIYQSPLPLTALSISWGGSEDNWDTSTMQILDEAFMEAAVLGISVFADSGDYGSNNVNNDGSPHVNYPASDPWVTGCGGTTISNLGSPAFSEVTWNDTLGATGGGVSSPLPGAVFPPLGRGFMNFVSGTGFPAPPWQAGLTFTAVGGQPTALTGRGVPDVAGNGCPNSGYPIITYGVLFGNFPNGTFGGTSAVAPLYASLIAILAARVGWPLGYLNPLLYSIAATPGQTSLVGISGGGNNALNPQAVLPGSSASVDPCTAYVATTGWNACTGLGRIDGAALLAALVLAEQTRPFDADVPFSFGGGGEWLNITTPDFEGGGNWNVHSQIQYGSHFSGDSIIAGRVNAWNKNDSTYLAAISDDNAVLAADNFTNTGGGVGVYGRCRGIGGSIGVAGVSSIGCGVYGICGGTATSPRAVGVVGRALGGLATEYLPIEDLVGEAVGVLGHATYGLGVRGHGGTLLKQPQAGQTLPASPSAPGGCFSSGRLSDQALHGATVQTVSLDAAAQLRLVPSTDATLPKTGQIGDLFFVYVDVDQASPVTRAAFGAQLWICTYVDKGLAYWERVQLGTQVAGGSKL
jgi:kumamolisin